MKIYNKIKSVLYYIFVIIFYFYLFIFASLYGIIYIYSEHLFIIIYLIIPILILLLPLIIKYLLREKNIKILSINQIALLIHFIIIMSLHYSINYYMSYFTIDKWSNPEWIPLRYLMIDNLEDKYNIIGMKKDKILNILGKPNYQDEDSICYDVKLYKAIDYNTYCLDYNSNDIIININKSWKDGDDTIMQVIKLDKRPENSNVSYIHDVLEYDRNNLEEQYKIFGKLKTLFGEPNYLSLNNEDWFGYFLEYKGKYFEVYGASDIPHIGGESSAEDLKLAKELAQYILKANPSDYEWTSYYMDSETKITYKVENGKASRVMEQLTLSDKEFNELYNQVYNLN